MARTTSKIYKEVVLPRTVRECHWLLKQLIDKLEVAKAARPGESVGAASVTEPFLRVPRIEGQG